MPMSKVLNLQRSINLHCLSTYDNIELKEIKAKN